ncbi:hypothetical protein DPMN_104502 [Dreissena polymorpha]|uniref:Uncharacterized protein n=1 Tax=Dreissena polymorpha TaxID=45954 RepID=A0A9D4HBR2_DREPO|nr:hypothetical protein DPMN_104502 [Dreissena polymorpha]
MRSLLALMDCSKQLYDCTPCFQVDEIMADLRVSFRNAYQQSRQQTQQICIHCPLHQYHNLCKDINGKYHHNLCKDINGKYHHNLCKDING